MNQNTKITMTPKKKIFFILFNLFLMAVVLFIGGEIFVRSKGFKPLKKAEPEVEVVPGGKYFQKDNDLGYTHLPGKFTVTLKKQLTFVTTHRADTLRITHPVEQDPQFEQKEKIWILGCSITHGWCLNDNQTYPWLLQEKIPGYEIINFGVSGYGTIHSLVQLEKALKTMPKPKLVILTYASFFDTRNTFSLARRRTVAEWNFLGPLTQPYASLDKQGNLVLHKADKVVYTPWPLARVSALINYLEEKYIARESKRLPQHEVSRALIRRINDICKKEGIPLIAAGIKDNPQKKMIDILRFCDKLKIPNLDISVDLEKPGYSFLPIDAHPSALANRVFADRLYKYLEENHFLDSSSGESASAAPGEK